MVFYLLRDVSLETWVFFHSLSNLVIPDKCTTPSSNFSHGRWLKLRLNILVLPQVLSNYSGKENVCLGRRYERGIQ